MMHPTLFAALILCAVAGSSAAVADITAVLKSFGVQNRVSMALDSSFVEPIFYDLPMVQQTTDYTCGPTSACSALRAFGFANVTEMGLAAEMGATPENGASIDSVHEVFVRRGLNATMQFNMTLADIRDVLYNGGIVIIDYEAWTDYTNVVWSSDWIDGHYSVAIGMDTENLYLMDPSQDEGFYGYVPMPEIVRRWHDYSNDPDVTTVHFGVIVYRGATGTPLNRIPVPSNIERTL